MNVGTIIVIALSVFLLLWYIGGYLYNRRRGRFLLRWLQEGLDVIGEEHQWGWLGSPASGARIVIPKAFPPFRRMEITLILENREIPILWLADRLQKKRDSAIIRATLLSPMGSEIQIGPLGEMPNFQFSTWHREPGPAGLTIFHRGPGASHQLAQMTPWLNGYAHYLRRLLLQNRDPHLSMLMNIAEMVQSHSARTFFQELRDALLPAKKETTAPAQQKV